MWPDANMSSSRPTDPMAPGPLGPLNHVAIVVESTVEALALYRDRLGLRVVDSEVLEDQHVRLTQIDLGACDLQLVEPLADHPDRAALLAGGERLHHLCFNVGDLASATAALHERGVTARDKEPRSGPHGRVAVFMDPVTTRDVLIELTASGPDRGAEQYDG
jgi:methylmalonyl-CoA/ethylmalonyl-CoA epimerase